MFVRGNSRKEVAAYLVQIAAEHMGLTEVSIEAATTTANAIGDYMRGLPDGPANIR
jgi:hypothetical protein